MRGLKGGAWTKPRLSRPTPALLASSSGGDNRSTCDSLSPSFRSSAEPVEKVVVSSREGTKKGPSVEKVSVLSTDEQRAPSQRGQASQSPILVAGRNQIGISPKHRGHPETRRPRIYLHGATRFLERPALSALRPEAKEHPHGHHPSQRPRRNRRYHPHRRPGRHHCDARGAPGRSGNHRGYRGIGASRDVARFGRLPGPGPHRLYRSDGNGCSCDQRRPRPGSHPATHMAARLHGRVSTVGHHAGGGPAS